MKIAVQTGTPAFELAALQVLAQTCNKDGQPGRVISICRQATVLSRKLADAAGEAITFGILGDAYHRQGRPREAVDSYLKALPLFRSISDRRFHALCLLRLGETSEALGDPRAVGYLEEGLALYRELGMPRRVEQVQQALERCRVLAGPALN